MIYLKLTSHNGTSLKKELSDGKKTWIIGRDPNMCDIVVSRTCTQVSRQHLRISRVNECYYLEDLGSTFGTFVNSKKLQPGEQTPYTEPVVLGNMDKDGYCLLELMPEKSNEVAVIEPFKPEQPPVSPKQDVRQETPAPVSPSSKSLDDIIEQIIQDVFYCEEERNGLDDENEDAPESLQALQQIQGIIMEDMSWENSEQANEKERNEEIDNLLQQKLPHLFQEFKHKFNVNAALEKYMKQHSDKEEIKQLNAACFPDTELSTRPFKEKLQEAIEEKLPKEIHKNILENIREYGPITSFIEDDTVDEIMVNGHRRIFVEKSGILLATGRRFLNEEALVSVIQKITEKVNRHIDEASPMVDARLKNGSRVNAVIRPLAFEGPSLTIRKFSKTGFAIDDLIKKGTLTKDMADFLATAVKARQNIIVSGGTGAGKTTLLNALCRFISPSERLVVIEDSAELKIFHSNRVRLESRPANIEGKGRITIRDLLVNALRMRPDRIIIGECRAGEALDMLQAMNTGHDGSLTTIHANSPRDTLSRLENMVLMAGFDLPVTSIQKQISSAVNLIVQVSRLSDGSRKITNISEITGLEGTVVSMQEIFTFNRTSMDSQSGRINGEFLATGNVPSFIDTLRQRNQLELKMDIFQKKTIAENQNQ